MPDLVELLWRAICTALPFHAASWEAGKAPIELILESADPEETRKLTDVWLEKMDRQLNNISVTSALISALVVTALAWPSISGPEEEDNPSAKCSSWPVLGTWYTSLLFSLTAIATATNQRVVIHRLSCYPDSSERTKRILQRSSDDPTVPDRLQLWVWQIPIAFLNGSIYCFVVGLAVLVWDVAKLSDLDFQAMDTKVLIVFMVVLPVCVVNYLVGTYGLYGKYWSSK